MTNVRYAVIDAEEHGQRLDNYLLRVLKGVPKSHIYRVIRNGEVRVNKGRAKASTRLCTGDNVRIPPIRTSQSDNQQHACSKTGQRLLNQILYEDESLLVMNKPSGIAVHGGSGLRLGLIESLRQARQDLPYLELIHRLDKDTSGCLLIAKKRRILRAMHALLEARNVEKTYWALLCHPWKGKRSLTVDLALEKNVLKSGERIVKIKDAGKPSQTHFTLLANYAEVCWVEASPKTGRTHQIRVHSAHLGHPILGDSKYGGTHSLEELSFKKSRLYLHARAIQFTLDGKQYAFQADLDASFTQVLKQLEE